MLNIRELLDILYITHSDSPVSRWTLTTTTCSISKISFFLMVSLFNFPFTVVDTTRLQVVFFACSGPFNHITVFISRLGLLSCHGTAGVLNAPLVWGPLASHTDWHDLYSSEKILVLWWRPCDRGMKEENKRVSGPWRETLRDCWELCFMLCRVQGSPAVWRLWQRQQ